MKKTMRQWWAAVVAALGWMGAVLGADIQYVADNGGGEYCGVGYGISVSVSAPASGYAVKYAEASTGPWQNTPVTYTDVCSAKPIYFQISADGYTTVVDSRTVTITPKALTADYVWLVLPTDDYVYDGTAKTPDVACGDGNPSIITTDDFDVSFTANVNAGTATATFTGKRNYTGTATEDFDILKADNGWKTEPSMPGWTYGQAASEPSSIASNGVAVVTYGTAASPGALGTTRPTMPGDYVATFTVAESQNYNGLAKDVPFTISPAAINFVADNVSGEYNGSGYGIDATISVSTPASGATVRYSTAETGPWQSDPILYTNACAATPIYFQISADGYTTVVDSRTVTITPKALTADYVWLVLPTDDYVYDGTAKTPDVACGDGNPSIITEDDFDVSFDANVNAGTATATFTGKRNYTGTATEDFDILKADNGWKTEPSMPGWTYGQAASEPSSIASNGVAVVTYGTAASPGALGTTRPTMPGDYVATFTVAESQNYKALTKDVAFTISPAAINFVADNVSGEYNGSGYGIDATISVSTPASGATVRYSTAEAGPWQADPILYTNACAATPIYFQISADGYTTVVDSRTVTITPKALTADYVWLVLPTADYVYDGTAKTPDVACGDGNPSIITTDDFDVSFDANVDAGTATATFTGKRNYTGTATEDFDILKADNGWKTEPSMPGWTYGQAASEPTSVASNGVAVVTYGTAGNPGSLGGAKPSLPGYYVATFTVAESQNYKELRKDVEFAILSAAMINFVADNVSGEYNGSGYGIDATISVSTPASGAVVRYSTAETGPWQSEPILYTNACAATPIYFEISATGYAAVTNSRTVTIAPKTLTSDYVWLVLPSSGYVYDGTAKVPGVACGDGNPSIITTDDFDVSFGNNVNAGTATATFTGKRNYAGTVVENFEIRKANLTNGEEPGQGGVPPGGISKFDVAFEYDGLEHTVDAEAILSAWRGVNANVRVAYALSRYAAEWTAAPKSFVDAGVWSIWYKVSLANYNDFIHEVKVAITPRDIANATIAPIDDVVFDGSAAEPTPTVTDGDPSIITADDYDVSYSGNDAPGRATVTLTGKRNYTGTTSASFTILEPPPSEAALSAKIAWKYLQATGTFFAQLKVVCTNGLECGIEELRFLFADRLGQDAIVNAALWDSMSRAENQNVTEFNGASCRYVSLDAGAIGVQDEECVFGVSEISGDSIPVSERTIEMYSRKRVAPRAGNEADGEVDDFVGYLVWKSNGREFFLSLLEGGEAMPVVPVAQLRSVKGLSVGGGEPSKALFAADGDVPETAVPYYGVLLDEEGAVRGSVEVSLSKFSRRAKNRKVNAKIRPIGEMQKSFIVAVDQGGLAEGTVAGEHLMLQIGVNGVEGRYGSWIVACARARSSANEDYVANVVDCFTGMSYGIVLETVASDADWVRDVSEVVVKVAGKGKANVKCVLADGTRLFTTSKVIVPGEEALCVPVVVRAYRGKKGGFGFLLWIDGDEVSVTGLSDLSTTGAKRAFDIQWKVGSCGVVAR